MQHPHLIEELEMRDTPRLWDADPDVCCAAFQLGACEHTEALNEDDIAELLAMSTEEIAELFTPTPTDPTAEEPF